MQPQQNFSGRGQGSADQAGAIVCAQCDSPMPREMRFCRSCGNRLGEGPAEYTETVRLPNAKATAAGRATIPFVPGIGVPLIQQPASALPYLRRWRFRGMTWVWIGMAIFFASGGALSTFIPRAGRHFPGAIHAPALPGRSYFGVDEFRKVDGGVSFDDVEPPGSPADEAGLVGGDIITTFDGHAVEDADEMMELLQQTPVGKRVEVVYLRDGETKKTQMTTISAEEYNQLERAFRSRPEGQGRMGYDDGRAKRVPIPGTNMYGVQLGSVLPNRPADLAGVKQGDIVIEFDGVPIRTGAELTSRVHRATPYSTIKLVVMRDGQRIEIPVKFGKGE
jgi:membrane-associated protease RseP (regulator of RpoE activity)